MSESLETKLAMGVMVLGTSQVIALLLGVAFSVVIARLIGPENYGLVGLALTYPTLIANLLEMGTGSVLIKYAASSSTEKRVYIWTAIISRTALGLAGSLVTYFLAETLSDILARPYITDYIRLLSVYVLAFTVLSALSSTFTGIRKYAITGSLSILQYALRGSLAVVLVLAGHGVAGVISSYSYAYALLCVVYLALFIKTFRKPVFAWNALTEIYRLSFPLFVATIAGMFVGPVVNTLLARYTSDFDIGNYNVGAVSLAPISVLLSSATATTISVLPIVEDEEELRRKTSSIAVYASSILIFLVLGYMSVLTPLIRLLYGPGFRDAPTYALIISVGHLASTILAGFVLGGYLITIGATRWNSCAGIVGSAITVLLSALLIPLFKAPGAAISYVAGLVASGVVLYIVADRLFNLRLPLSKVIRTLIPALLGFTCAKLIPFRTAYLAGPLDLVAEILLLGIIYVLIYLTLLPLFVDRATIKKLVEFSAQLSYIRWIAKPFGKIYLEILGIRS